MRPTGFGDSTTVPVRGYVINVSLSADGFSKEIKIYSGSGYAYNYTALAAGITYRFKLWAVTGTQLHIAVFFLCMVGNCMTHKH